ncbi:MAG: ABC transporter ATP-binding protein [Bacteroidota bacterium]
MQIELRNLGKRFNRQWIFRKLDFQFTTGNAYAIVGPNGSGKSTLLQVIAGAVEKSEGDSLWTLNNQLLPPEAHYKHTSIAAPYLELIEELTLFEFLSFHHSFKPFLDGYSVTTIIDTLGLKDAANKQIRNFSSGMKQRVKLAQAIFTKTTVVMLDEPTSNLDIEGIELYNRLLATHCQERLLIICSNDEAEIQICKHRLAVNQYKYSTTNAG